MEINRSPLGDVIDSIYKHILENYGEDKIDEYKIVYDNIPLNDLSVDGLLNKSKIVCERIGVDVNFLYDIKRKDTRQHEEEKLVDLQNKCFMEIAARREDNATELVVQYIEKNNYIKSTADDIKSEVWFYQEGVYKPNGESKIKEITREILTTLYTPQRVNKIIAKIKADTHIEPDEFFNFNILEEIPVMNGILNIKTRELNDFTPNKIFFNKLPVYYNPEATCPNIDIFFKDVLREEDNTKVLEELFGYCLYKDHFIEKAFMFVGDGRNGKGKTISLLKYFLGIENCSGVSLSQLIPNSTSVCELHGKLANLAGDLSNTSLKETGLFKEITGRDLIGAKRKYLRDLFFVNYSKQVFACNELPKVYDSSDGFWERWLLFEFPYKFVDQKVYDLLSDEDKKNCKIKDVNIINKITSKEEMSGLLNKALDGLQRLLDNQCFSYSKSLTEVKDMWVRKSDSFEAFCIDNINEQFDAYVPKKIIRKMFVNYCKEHNLKGASDVAIKARLENEFGVTEDRIDLKMFGFSEREHCWNGINLKKGVSFIKENGEFTIRQGSHPFSKTLGIGNYSTFENTLGTLTNNKQEVYEEKVE